MDHGKGIILNLNHDFKTPGMWNVDNALNVYVKVCWVIFYLNFKSILSILVHCGAFLPPPNDEDYKKMFWFLTGFLLFKKKNCGNTYIT